MKKLLLILLSLITLNIYSQDGLCGYINDDSTSVFISIYNSDANHRNEICSYVYDCIADESCYSRIYVIIFPDNSTISGELFITEGVGYILYNFYVDSIIYPNGLIYTDKRYSKPSPSKNKF